MKATLVCDALRMAIWLRRPPPGLIVHSDRGSQYASKAYRNLLKAYGFIGSITKPAMKHSRLRRVPLAPVQSPLIAAPL
jgi:transposase InsO family protein